MNDAVHLPVLLREAMGYLNLKVGGTYLDATVGLGGHAKEMLNHIGQDGILICTDRDEEALETARQRLNDSRCIYKKTSFSGLGNAMEELNVKKVDGILMDLGVSMLQLKSGARGFGFNSEARLDMRMDASQALSAFDIVNGWPEKDLQQIFKEYGEERFARRIASAIVIERKKRQINTCRELSELIESKVGRRGRLHPATRVFQALRIAVNNELSELETGLHEAYGLLNGCGRLAVISYHSLEDRIVKNFVRESAKAGKMVSVTKKPIVPDAGELRTNPSARSAKMRVAEVSCDI